MSRTITMIGASLLATLAFATSTLHAQDLSPSKPPSGTETPVQPPATDAPRRPNAQQPPGQQRRLTDVVVPEDIQLVKNVVYATVEGKDGKPIELKMDCAFLKQSDGKPMPVVMYIHGGGWSGGDRSMGVPFAIAFARGGYFACTTSYRLSGEATFPAQINDVKAAVRFLRANAEKLVIDPDRIGVWGHSAGGHLSALLGVTGDDKSLDGNEGEPTTISSAVEAVVDISGPTDLVRIAPGGNGGPMVSQFLGGTVRDKADVAKAASPVNYVDAKDAPFLIIQGGNDNLVPNEQAEIMRDALKGAGVECEYLYVPEAGHTVQDRRAYQATAAFFDKHLGGDSVDALGQIGRRLEGAAGGAQGAGGGAAQRPRRPNAQQPPAATQPAQEDAYDCLDANSTRAIIAAMSMATVDVQSEAIVRGVLEALTDDKIILALPHTAYRVHLVPTVPAASIATPIGKRIKGTIHARALRIFKASGGGGGQFIEPLNGAPRIVAGRVVHVDAAGRRLLVDVAAPIWMTLAADNNPSEFAPGDMVNCYVESGTRFTPA